jgi:DNA-binding NarL/FixJ family response regulator
MDVRQCSLDPRSWSRYRWLIAESVSSWQTITRLFGKWCVPHCRNSPVSIVCGEAENGAEAIELAKQIKPDVAILNVMMPVLNGFDAAREIKKHVPQSAIVILSTHADRLFVNEAKKMGIRVYVSKTKVGEALVKAVEAAVRGEDFIVLE